MIDEGARLQKKGAQEEFKGVFLGWKFPLFWFDENFEATGRKSTGEKIEAELTIQASFKTWMIKIWRKMSSHGQFS